jgi:hypothetical protein
MRVRQQNIKGFDILLHQGIPQIADASSRVENNQTLTDPHFDTAGISAERNVSWGWGRYTAPYAPKSNLHRHLPLMARSDARDRRTSTVIGLIAKVMM